MYRRRARRCRWRCSRSPPRWRASTGSARTRSRRRQPRRSAAHRRRRRRGGRVSRSDPAVAQMPAVPGPAVTTHLPSALKATLLTLAGVALEHANGLARRDVPDARVMVEARGREQRAVRAERDRVDGGRVPRERRRGLPLRHAPDLRAAVGSGGREVVAVGAERDIVDDRGVEKLCDRGLACVSRKTRATLSMPAVASNLPSGESASARTAPGWENLATSVWLLRFQSRVDPSAPAAATSLPSWLNVTSSSANPGLDRSERPTRLEVPEADVAIGSDTRECDSVRGDRDAVGLSGVCSDPLLGPVDARIPDACRAVGARASRPSSRRG